MKRRQLLKNAIVWSIQSKIGAVIPFITSFPNLGLSEKKTQFGKIKTPFIYVNQNLKIA